MDAFGWVQGRQVPAVILEERIKEALRVETKIADPKVREKYIAAIIDGRISID
jgi:hypothetical protein